jgi:hypothetical protein
MNSFITTIPKNNNLQDRNMPEGFDGFEDVDDLEDSPGQDQDIPPPRRSGGRLMDTIQDNLKKYGREAPDENFVDDDDMDFLSDQRAEDRAQVPPYGSASKRNAQPIDIRGIILEEIKNPLLFLGLMVVLGMPWVKIPLTKVLHLSEDPFYNLFFRAVIGSILFYLISKFALTHSSPGR